MNFTELILFLSLVFFCLAVACDKQLNKIKFGMNIKKEIQNANQEGLSTLNMPKSHSFSIVMHKIHRAQFSLAD